jgi:hypothetical protein
MKLRRLLVETSGMRSFGEQKARLPWRVSFNFNAA